MKIMNEAIAKIKGANNKTMAKEEERIDNLSKPIGSLGEMESIVIRLKGIFGEEPINIAKRTVVIMCADNGVVEAGVSSNPQEVTQIVTRNFEKGITGVNALARYYHSDLTVVDIGINGEIQSDFILNRKIRLGTDNMIKGPAMTREEALKAIEIGIEVVTALKKSGYQMLGTGEMGVGNTATSAAVFSVLSGLTLEEVAGKGAGLTEKQFKQKKAVLEEAIRVNKPDKNDVIDVISKVGGFDIAGLCGCFIGAAANNMPIVIDGLIASVAAYCALLIEAKTKDYMFASHLSNEAGAKHVMKALDLNPMLTLNMRLGEGSGCPLAFGVMDAAVYTLTSMGTFEEAALNRNDYVDMKKENN